jgi:hypothetical protein
MKFVSLLPRFLLGLAFTLFGTLGLLHPMQQPETAGDAATLGQILFTSHWLALVLACQVIGGILLLLGKVPLGLVFLGPILVNILLYHALLAPAGILPGAICAVLFLIMFWQHRKSFAPIFKD